MNTRINNRIKEIITEYAVKKSALASKIGVTPQAINKWCTTGQIDNDNIEKLLEAFPFIRRDWLYFGEGEKYKTVDEANTGKKDLENYKLLEKKKEALEKIIQTLFKVIDIQEEYIERLKEDLEIQKGSKVEHIEKKKEDREIWDEIENGIKKRNLKHLEMEK